VTTVFVALAFDLLLGEGSTRSGRFGVFFLTPDDPDGDVDEDGGNLPVCREAAGGEGAAAGGEERRTHGGQWYSSSSLH